MDCEGSVSHVVLVHATPRGSFFRYPKRLEIVSSRAEVGQNEPRILRYHDARSIWLSTLVDISLEELTTRENSPRLEYILTLTEKACSILAQVFEGTSTAFGHCLLDDEVKPCEESISFSQSGQRRKGRATEKVLH